jgi:hypothetical protein
MPGQIEKQSVIYKLKESENTQGAFVFQFVPQLFFISTVDP